MRPQTSCFFSLGFIFLTLKMEINFQSSMWPGSAGNLINAIPWSVLWYARHCSRYFTPALPSHWQTGSQVLSLTYFMRKKTVV